MADNVNICCGPVYQHNKAKIKIKDQIYVACKI